MSKYINADEFKKKIQEHHYILSSYDNSKDFGMFDIGIERVIDEMPSADVREVVRCKDCEEFWETIVGNFCLKRTTAVVKEYVNPDDFCSYGERKET